MKTLAFVLCVFASTASGQTKITSHIFFPASATNQAGEVFGVATTNIVTVAAGEAAKVLTIKPLGSYVAESPQVSLVKSGAMWHAGQGDAVEGPAQFVVVATPGRGEFDGPALLTLERLRVPKSLVVPMLK